MRPQAQLATEARLVRLCAGCSSPSELLMYLLPRDPSWGSWSFLGDPTGRPLLGVWVGGRWVSSEAILTFALIPLPTLCGFGKLAYREPAQGSRPKYEY